MYDNIVSLGYNCEVSFRIKDFMKEQGRSFDSYLYSWVYITNRFLMLDSIENFDLVLSGDLKLLPWGMVRCEKTAMDFHMRNKQLWDDMGNIKPREYQEALTELKSRVSHLKMKTAQLIGGWGV